MKRDYYMLGAIVGSTSDRWSEEEICPQQFKRFATSLESGDELVLHFNSPGGDVFAGFTIAQMIRDLANKGVKTVAVVEGLAASIASVIACACDELKMYESSFLMCHNCWSVVMGNADQLRKEADTMDKIDSAIRTFYHKHFDMTDEELGKMMDAETWISGEEVKDYKLNCEVLKNEKQYRIAACLNKMNFNKVPERLRNRIMENKTEDEVKTTTTEDVVVENAEPEVEEAKNVEQPSEPVEEPKDEEPKAEEPEEETRVEDSVPMAEVEKRVSGMQSTMAKKMDAMKKDYEAKILDFENQLKAKDEELANAKAEATSLEQRLEVANEELSKATSALEEKSNALATLNANVLTPDETKESWRNLKGQKFLDYVNAHKKELSNIKR